MTSSLRVYQSTLIWQARRDRERCLFFLKHRRSRGWKAKTEGHDFLTCSHFSKCSIFSRDSCGWNAAIGRDARAKLIVSQNSRRRRGGCSERRDEREERRRRLVEKRETRDALKIGRSFTNTKRIFLRLGHVLLFRFSCSFSPNRLVLRHLQPPGPSFPLSSSSETHTATGSASSSGGIDLYPAPLPDIRDVPPNH